LKVQKSGFRWAEHKRVVDFTEPRRGLVAICCGGVQRGKRNKTKGTKHPEGKNARETFGYRGANLMRGRRGDKYRYLQNRLGCFRVVGGSGQRPGQENNALVQVLGGEETGFRGEQESQTVIPCNHVIKLRKLKFLMDSGDPMTQWRAASLQILQL